MTDDNVAVNNLERVEVIEEIDLNEEQNETVEEEKDDIEDEEAEEAEEEEEVEEEMENEADESMASKSTTRKIVIFFSKSNLKCFFFLTIIKFFSC